MTARARAPLSSRACQAVARVFAFDPMLARAFEQLDADVHVERTVAGRHADAYAWLALLRLLGVAVPATMAVRVLDLRVREWRLVFGYIAALAAMPCATFLFGTLFHELSFGPPGHLYVELPVFAVILLTASQLSGYEAFRRIVAARASGAVCALLTGVVAVWLVMLLLVQPTLAGIGWLPRVDVVVRVILWPALGAQAAWLGMQRAVRGLGSPDQLTTFVLIGFAIGATILPDARTPLLNRLTDREFIAICIAVLPMTFIVTAALSSRIARFPLKAAHAVNGETA